MPHNQIALPPLNNHARTSCKTSQISLLVAGCALGLLSACGGGSSSTASNDTGTGAQTSSSSGSSSSGSSSSSSGSQATGKVYGSMAAASLGIGANLNGAIPFTSTSEWNRDISSDPVDPNSDNLIAAIGVGGHLKSDFGTVWQGAPIGIPYLVVSSSQTKVKITFTDYGDESDTGPYPVPANAPIEGQQISGAAFGGDRHVLVIDKDNNRLYEMGNAYPQPDGSWLASGGAIFNLDGTIARPTAQPGWTSADAAGLPIFPGLVRYDEANGGGIFHALRFTASVTRKAYLPPATHWASSNTDVNRPPMGVRVRLKASYQIPANFSKESKAILQALKTYGMLLADNGSNWYISGAPDSRWNDETLAKEVNSVQGSALEVVKMNGMVAP